MGIYDRDYVREERGPSITDVGRTATGNIILITVLVWIAQLILRGQLSYAADSTTLMLGIAYNDLFSGGIPKIWGLITATFAHDVWDLNHILFNMVFLYAFGRHVETRYGRRELWAFYLLAGALAALAEVVSLGRMGQGDIPVIGASGAVMALMSVYVLLGPREPVNLLIFHVPRWAIAAFFIFMDLRGVTDPTPRGVANLAHIVGAAFGLLYFRFDFRLLGRGRKATILRFPRAETPKAPLARKAKTPLPIRTKEAKERVDELLGKISAVGQSALTEEELAFLKEHAHLFRKS